MFPGTLLRIRSVCRSCRSGLLLAVVTGMMACNRVEEPKPRGYVRIDLPEHRYDTLSAGRPICLEVPVYAQLEQPEAMASEGGFNLVFPDYGATLYMTYKPVDDNLDRYLRDAQRMVQRTARDPSDVQVSAMSFPERRIFGALYDIGGDAASAVQFFLTDSLNHFLRGALYFRQPARRDSLEPVIRFLRQDIGHLMETVSWKEPGHEKQSGDKVLPLRR